MAQRQDSMDDLLSMDLGRLLDVQVSVATRREENAFALPAAITVFTAGDIRRSGHRRLADLLQDAPGFHVGKWDANKWAVSSRNSLSRFSSTLLVLVDGRPAYTPLYGGVRWEAQNIMLADVERIEIIRGSGGPLWGGQRGGRHRQRRDPVGEGHARQPCGTRCGRRCLAPSGQPSARREAR
jgi:iron complex outermembrane receptor protein